ncbi:MAG: glycosyltransferase [Planctomycetota bacterium]
MLFLTVGAQMPFDRLVRTVDHWAGLHERRDVFAQIGPAEYTPSYLRFERFLAPAAFRTAFAAADLVVAHAGMGTIITALELAKPILVMPRRGSLGETRNDHQIATAARFGDLGLVHVAADEVELQAALDRLDVFVEPSAASPAGRPRPAAACAQGAGGCPCFADGACAAERLRGAACHRLLAGLRAFIAGAAPPLAPALSPAPLRLTAESSRLRASSTQHS